MEGKNKRRSKSPEMTAKRRKSLKKSEFGLPDERKYPVDTRGRAANAKARATQQYDRGNLTMSEKNKIDRKADDVLYGKNKKKKDDMYEKKRKTDKKRKMKKHYDSVDEMRKDAKRKGMY